MNERNFDEEIMKEAGRLLADERLAEFDRLAAEPSAADTEEEKHVFSSRFGRKKDKLFRKTAENGRRAPTANRKALRAALICAAALLIMSVTAAAVPPVRDMILETRTRIVSRWSGDSVLRLNVETDVIPDIEPTGEPTYLPEGYEVAEVQVRNLPEGEAEGAAEGAEDGHVSMVWISYERPDSPDGEYTPIVLGRVPCMKNVDRFPGESEYAGIGFYFGGEYRDTEPVQIGAYEGVLIREPITEDSRPGQMTGSMLVWSDSYFYYDLSAVIEEVPGYDLIPLPYEELLRMAESFYQ